MPLRHPIFVKRRILLLFLLALVAAVFVANVVYTQRKYHHATHLPPAAMEALEGAEQMTLFSIDPGRFPTTPPGTVRFHANIILGETVISNATQRRQISHELQRAVSASDGDIAMCFEPRHGLRVARAGKTYDFLICYQCKRVDTFVGEESIESTGLAGNPQFFNAILRAANIPLAPTPEEMTKSMMEAAGPKADH
jgi:hypothetical protein